MKKALLACLVVVLYVLHQDYWNWRTSDPVVLGIFPIGLFYHMVYTLVVSLVMWLLVKLAWPGHLEVEAGESSSEGGPRA